VWYIGSLDIGSQDISFLKGLYLEESRPAFPEKIDEFYKVCTVVIQNLAKFKQDFRLEI